MINIIKRTIINIPHVLEMSNIMRNISQDSMLVHYTKVISISFLYSLIDKR